MKINYHNKISIHYGNKDYIFFNTMLDSIYSKIANFESFVDKIAIGSGISEDFSNNFKLSKFITSSTLETETLQNNLFAGDLFVKKNAVIKTQNLNCKYITEAGISSNLDDEANPTIYNYFSFISDNTPNGIEISSGEDLIITVTIYLNLTSDSAGLFTAGDNPFIKFLLGSGTDNNKIYIARGNDFSENVLVERSNDFLNEKIECTISSTIQDGISISISGDLNTGETNEIVFFLGEKVFARLNTLTLQKNTQSTESFSSKKNNIIDIGQNIVSVEKVYNNSTASDETNYFLVDYAINFSSKTPFQFNNLFSANTTRFISKDGDKLLFLVDDIIHVYRNSNYNVEHVASANFQIKNIIKLVCFDSFIFIFTKTQPYVYAYLITSNGFSKCNLNLTAFEHYSNLATFTNIDIVQGKNGTFMLGFIAPVNGTTAYTLYLTYDESSKTFSYIKYVSSNQDNYVYLLAFHKNNFSDAQIIYLRPGASSSQCFRAVHALDGTITTSYNVTSYYYTYATTSICVKSRAVVIEKDANPNFWLYYYPQIYRYSNTIFSQAEKNYISTNLHYLMQKLSDGTFRIYNLIGYTKPEIFSNGLPTDIDQSKILDVEFLTDTVLFFMDDENEPILAYNLNINSTCIENVTTQNSAYTITLTRKSVLGGDSQGVLATLSINITI